MQELTKYKCDFCGKEYDVEMECESCEQYHVHVASVLSYTYLPKDVGPEAKYPHTIMIQMEDGKRLMFKR